TRQKTGPCAGDPRRARGSVKLQLAKRISDPLVVRGRSLIARGTSKDEIAPSAKRTARGTAFRDFGARGVERHRRWIDPPFPFAPSRPQGACGFGADGHRILLLKAAASNLRGLFQPQCPDRCVQCTPLWDAGAGYPCGQWPLGGR